MSDYTPTTEDIRAGWEYATAVIGDEGTAQFDRWLAEHDAEVAKAERQGIIRCIENKFWDCGNGNVVDSTVEEITALIQGENN